MNKLFSEFWFSWTCAWLQVVDIGSGRGYLGCHLSLMYQIPVVGIDSSPSNTGSAAERTHLLRKHWNGLVSLLHTEHICV